MNKKLFLVLSLWGSTISLSAQQAVSETTVKGEIEGIKTGKLHLIAQTGEEKFDTLGTCTFKKSRFVLKAEVNEPMVTQLVVEGYQGGFRLMAEPGVTYEALLTNDNRSYIRGGKLQDEMERHLAFSDSLRREIQDVRGRYESHKAQSKFRSASLANDTLRKREQLLHTTTQKFLSSHDDLITAYTFQTNALMKEAGLAESKRMYESMGPGAKATLSARLMLARIERLEKSQGGALAPDFTLQDLNGKEVTLSQVPGKIKILDFWASWCGPCRLNNPALKKLYEEFHPKGLEVISVSLDNKKPRWEDAVAKDGLNWINVSSLKGWKCDIARQYNVTAIPAIFVLDAENRIIASNLRDEELKAFLEERLK